jgi:two-component system, OmpR family, sensor histidine kinase KdpD
MARGRLRVYLGAAPGVGKTVAMLGEGHRRLERGTDVVVGFVETHDRPHTATMLVGLETVPRQEVEYRGTTFTELDVDAVIRRRPAVVLIDELAHTNVPGVRNEKRWQDIEELLDAGIDVITTVNIQHLESLNDVVEKITGIPQRERVPDSVVRSADQVELVDMSPEALRRRMAHGNIYGPEKIDAALGNYFRPGNLTALRELALLWTADKVDEALQRYRAEHEIDWTWEARERVVVALTGGPEGETLIRRAARVAARSQGGDLLAVHVTRSDGLTGANPARLADQRRLVETLGGTYHQIIGDDPADALITFARAENATQLVLGGSRRSRWAALWSGPGIGSSVVRQAGDIDVHIVPHKEIGQGRGIPRLHGSLSRQRLTQGFVLAVALPILLTISLVGVRDHLNLVSDVLLFMLAVVVVSLVGGWWPSLVAALASAFLLNYYFTPPLHTLTIAETNNSLALVVFLLVASLVSSVVNLAARRTRQAARAAAESETLGTLAGSVLRGETALPALLERIREAFTLTSVSLLERTHPGEQGRGASGRGPTDDWTVVACTGPDPCQRPDEADIEVPAGDNLLLALRGRPLRAEDQRLIGAFAAQAAVVLERSRLNEAIAAAAPLAAADKMRTALLAAVGHDLRTPLAAAKAAVTSLRSRDIRWSKQDRDDLLLTADESLDRLTRLVDNLLDMSRLQAGAMTIMSRPVAPDEILPRVLDDLGDDGRRVVVDVPDDLPEVEADPGLLERVIVNVLSNAVRYSPDDRPPRVSGSALGDRVELRIVDKGPGIPQASRDQVFAAFQRLGDTDNTTGLGLGLALARGLVEAMGGTLTPEDTPGGGLTMVISLIAAGGGADASAAEPGQRERAGARDDVDEDRSPRPELVADDGSSVAEPVQHEAR